MTTLAAGLGAALAAGPDEANAQATEIVVPLESHSAVGEEIVMDVRNVAYETQTAIMDHLTTCIEAADITRDECVGEAATMMATERLDGVVREARERLAPLGESIGLTPAELIQEPDFCYAASTDAEVELCRGGAGDVQLAAAQYENALARERVIVAETHEAERLAALESAQEANIARRERNDGQAETIEGQAETIERQAETIDAQAAVLAALRRVAAEERGVN